MVRFDVITPAISQTVTPFTAVNVLNPLGQTPPPTPPPPPPPPPGPVPGSLAPGDEMLEPPQLATPNANASKKPRHVFREAM
jgi:hypothetical protein